MSEQSQQSAPPVLLDENGELTGTLIKKFELDIFFQIHTRRINADIAITYCEEFPLFVVKIYTEYYDNGSIAGYRFGARLFKTEPDAIYAAIDVIESQMKEALRSPL